ncbi:PKD domain-containing protein [Methylobacter sp. YRD-M1]|uniref:PKD domain-containing protein n=1 Tax=Methylobacter sp. YRD-M1 TaxID=2911520 RepID=UPI00227B943B|nr:PKD domain-containing protein [Methylobacter sp. YRD-M1]WAK00551.1 PKD domain-containing protein [Methylobacter sp. YRD-M1]
MNNYPINIFSRGPFPCFGLVGLTLLLFSSQPFAASVNLAWDASQSPNVGGYIVSYGPSSGKYTSSIDVGNKTAHTVCGLQEGQKYFFAVKAYDSARITESNYANEVSKIVPITAALTADFTASTTSGAPGLVVNFTPVSSGTVISWKWDFPGSISPSVTNRTAEVVTATYPNPGKYSVSLTLIGPNESVTKTKRNLVTVEAK